MLCQGPRSGIGEITIPSNELSFVFQTTFYWRRQWLLPLRDLVWQTHLLEREVFIAIWIVIFGLLTMYLLGIFKLSHDSDSIIDNTQVYKYEQVDNVRIKGIEMNVHYHPHFAHHLHFEESLTIMEGKEGNSFLALMPS
ncbi:hypothetical protein N9Y89_01680 [bacterium]|nr:hypothetical protein [bacterium]